MRASRLLSILILLQLRGRLTAAGLAEEFEVSERTIYRDIDALSAAGIPVYGDRGPGGGFQLLDGYRTQLTGLSASEAEAVAMIGLPGPAGELGLGAATSAAQNKLIAVLPASGGARADRMAARFHLDAVDWYRGGEALPHLPAIARAVLDQHALTMRYESWQGVRDWTVDPLGLVLKAGIWYLAARGGAKVRIFRIANIDALTVGDALFDRPADFRLASWWQAEQARFEAELFATKATLRASPEGCKRLAAQSPRGSEAVARAVPPAADGWRAMTMMVEDSDHGARDMLALGAEVEVLEPASFRDRIAALARDIAARHVPVGQQARRRRS